MKQKQYHAGESVWRVASQVFNDTIPAQMSCWLFDPASLTSRLVAACSKTFRVQVLEQTWRTPMHSELRRLGMPCRQTALIREVLLFCGETPWVFARTVIPQRTLTGKRKFLANLGTKPLGAVLFADPHMKRDEIEVARLSAGQPLYERAVQALSDVPPTIWGRRSVFYLQDKPLLVNEIFLPGIASCPRPTTKY
jgi:chorismate--pyruvate lyase